MRKKDFLKFGFILNRFFRWKKGQWWRGVGRGARTAGGAVAGGARRVGRETKRVVNYTVVKPVQYVVKPAKWGYKAKQKVDQAGRKTVGFMRGQFDGRDYSGWMFILMTVMLYIFDVSFRFNGINIQRFLENIAFTSIESYIGWFFNSIVLTLLIAYWVLYKPGAKEFISWFLVAETLSLIIFMGGMGTMLIHLAFVIGFYFLYIRYTSGDTPEGHTNANFIFFFLLAFDFFGYGLLAEFVKNPIVSNRLIIPIWFYFALIYTHEQERSFWINAIIFFVILMNVFYFVGGINGLRSMAAGLTPEETQEGLNFLQTSWHNVWDTFGKAWEGFQADLESRLEYATGGYYKGKVEKNKIGPLGVFIEGLKTSQPRYYPSENVIIWGTIKALNLDEGVNIKIGCHKEGEEADVNLIKVLPDKPFTIYSLETRDFECQFKPGSLPAGREIRVPHIATLHPIGIHTLTVDAEFNFGTLAYLKSYFMDLERKRGMVREGLDPFKEFGIEDTNPIAVYTNGPVAIGMETTSPIIEVGEEIITQPRLGITLENREGWEGVITSLTELVLLMPPGIEISQPDNDCGDVSFKYYYENECKDGAFCCSDKGGYEGKGSCEKFVFKPCVDVCVDRKMASEGYKNKLEQAKEDCKRTKDCVRDYENCKKDCGVLFEGENEKSYTGYALDTTKINIIDRFKDIDRFRSFSCRLNVKPDVLGPTPITVKYFRAKARYNYTLSKDIDVEVQASPGTAVDVSQKIEVTGFIPERINQIAGELGVDKSIALGVAAVESGFRHCCKDGTGTKAITCVGTEEESCQDRLIAGEYQGRKVSFGVMQLNKHVHEKLYNPSQCESGSKEEDCIVYKKAKCEEGENAYNLDCNIKLGLAYLKYLYDKHGSNTRVYSCNGKSYTGWELALRYYNGFTCKGDVNYVEKVKQKIEDIGEGKLNVLIGEKFDKDVISEQDYIEEELQPPLYFDVECYERCSLKWGASPSSEVQYYVINRSGEGIAEGIIIIIQVEDGKYEYEYTDEPPKEGRYIYSIRSGYYVDEHEIESKPLKKVVQIELSTGFVG